MNVKNTILNLKSKGLSNIDTLLKNESLVINQNKEGIFLMRKLTYIESIIKGMMWLNSQYKMGRKDKEKFE